MHILTQNLLKSIQEAEVYMDLKHQGSQHALFDLQNWYELIKAYEILEDQISRKTFSKLIALRNLYFKIPLKITREVLSLYPKGIWEKLLLKAETIQGVHCDYPLDRIETWILKGYEYKDCRAKDSDVVIDAGAFTGNTVMYFSQCVGEKGKVYAFEPMADIFQVLKNNVNHLPQVELFQLGISDKDDTVYVAQQNYPGASLLVEGDVSVTTRSIDSFVQEKALERIDFLKMDIEGLEMDALLGAKNSIKQFHPKMAISVYHKITDIFEVYKRILEYNPYYKFYLKHSSNVLWETVLFCMPSKTAQEVVENSEDYVEDIAIAKFLERLYKKILALSDENREVSQKNVSLEEHVTSLLKALKTK